MLKINDIITELEKIAPLKYQETYDNAGLLTGNTGWEATGALICLDSTEEVIDEAIAANCNLVIAHHPILFGGIKKINGDNYIERTLIKAIKHDIAIYAIHTNLDNVAQGVNKKICEKLDLKNCRILSQKKGVLKKLVTFCPEQDAEKVRNALFKNGAGNIGNYNECSFNLSGQGTFKGNPNSNPIIGEKGKRHTENEIRIEVIFEISYENNIVSALKSAHPYEEVAFDIYPLDNYFQFTGSGMIGELENEQTEKEFLLKAKRALNAPVIKHTRLLNKKVKKVAVCGGAGIFLLNNAIASGAGIFITGDVKYHQFFDADGKIVLADVGHYESEQFTCELLYQMLNKLFPTFALRLTKISTNPVNYL